MEILVPASWKAQVLVYIVVTLSLPMSLVDGDSSLCIPGINIAREQNFSQSLGKSLILKCPVRMCYTGLPNVTWCKLTGELCIPVRAGERIESSIEDHTKDNAVYVLKFVSVQFNDTGYYQCKAIYKDHQIVGSTVQIIILAEHLAEHIATMNITETDNTANFTNDFQTFTFFLYIVSSLGGVCVLIIIVSLLIYCQTCLKVKHRSPSQDPAPTEELQFVATPGRPKNYPQQTQGGTSTPTDTDPTAVTVEVTYDNAHMGYLSTTHKDSKLEEEDSIIYADLSHSATIKGFQFENDCEVEYATVQLNESRKHYP